jgi:pimeloyl-ACP methyl ester carboxylesterase
MRLSSLAAVACVCSASFANTIPNSYAISVDTSLIAGTQGYIDLQLDPGVLPVDAAQVDITGYNMDGPIIIDPLSFSSVSGDVSGSLLSDLTIANTTAFNDFFQEVGFGNFITFDVTFSGPALSSPTPGVTSGSTFSFSLYDSTASTPLLSSDPTGAVLSAQIGPSGQLSVTPLPGNGGGPSVATATPIVVGDVPPAVSLLCAGLCAAFFVIATASRRGRAAHCGAVLLAACALVTPAARAATVQVYAGAPGQNPSAVSAKSLFKPMDTAQCPNQHGVINVASVPVANVEQFYLGVNPPAPFPITLTITSTNTAVLGGSLNQGFIPQVTIATGSNFSTLFSLYGQSLGQATIIITDTSGFYPTLFLPVTTWNVGTSATEHFLDANNPLSPCRDVGSSSISTNPDLLAACGVPASWIASDGVAELLMRGSASLPGTVCYAITSTAASGAPQGTVQTAVATTVPEQGLQEAFSLYTSPGYYGDLTNHRTVTIQFSYTPSASVGTGNTSSFSANLTVVRPPLVLVHGLWSDSGSWPNFWTSSNQYEAVYHVADYSSTNGSSFSVNVPKIQQDIATTLSGTRRHGIAVAQTDVVAHSMGGLLTRLYTGTAGYKTPQNYGQGDVMHLVTLDTPHYGSSFANLLVNLHQAKPASAEATVRSITGGDMTQGAVCDLSENSPALAVLSSSPTQIPSQVITGTRGPSGSPGSPALFWGGFLGLHSFEAALTATRNTNQLGPNYVFPQSWVNAYRFIQANDSIVSLLSQQGGIGAGYSYNLLHAGFFIFGGLITLVPSVTNQSNVEQQVMALLSGPPSGFVPSFPPVPSDGGGGPLTAAQSPLEPPGIGGGVDQANYAAQCSPGGVLKPAIAQAPRQGGSRTPVRPRAAVTASPLVQITSPNALQVFAPGASINVTVQIDPSLNAMGATLYTTGADSYSPTSFSSTGFTATVAVPSFFTGPLTLTPVVWDGNGTETWGAGVTVSVRPSSNLSSVTLTQHDYVVAPGSSGGTLALVGNAGSTQPLNLTSSASGTTYQSSNTGVVSVNGEGAFTVGSVGTAVITAANSGLKDFATFVVEDPANPLPPQDLTSQAGIVQSGLTLNRQTGFFTGTVTITNPGTLPLIGPLYYVLSGLTGGVTLANASGIATSFQPGSPFIRLTSPGQPYTLAPGGVISFQVQFLNPNRVLINAQPHLLGSSVEP